jgi:hypothetical protein
VDRGLGRPTTSPHVTAPCRRTVSTSEPSAPLSPPSLTVQQVLSPFRLLPGGTSRFSLRPFDPTSLFDGGDVAGSRLAETFEIELFDEAG